MNDRVKVPFFSAAAVNGRPKIASAIDRVLESSWFVLGHEVDMFEREFADYCGVECCVSVANGTDALEIALKALDVKAGDRVVLAANAGFYASTAIHMCGAVPVYVDIDPKLLTFSVSSLDHIFDHKPKAIVVTHLYGQMANIEEIVSVASKMNVPVIEDCAQAHGAYRNGKRAGSIGTIGCFSFYPTKNLGAVGDGGALTTNGKELANKIKQLRQYGWSTKYHVDLPSGRNSRLDELQAAVLRTKLSYLDEANAMRKYIALRYNEVLRHYPVICPRLSDNEYVAHLYVIQIDERKKMIDHLKRNNIACDIHYPVPDHLQSAYSCSQKSGSLPITEQVCKKVLSLPCYPGMTNEQVESVITAMKQFYG